MAKINIKKFVQNINKTNVYTPVIEAVVNSIQAIEETRTKNGSIEVRLIRVSNAQGSFDDDALPPVTKIKIRDNGIGFINDNIESFNTLFSDFKEKKGGKGFGRFTFLKYFEEVLVESVFPSEGSFLKRSFKFIADDEIITNQEDQVVENEECFTEVTLNGLKERHLASLNKSVPTIARKLLDNLLFYFVLENYDCPKITVTDGVTTLVLNELLSSNKEIQEIGSGEFQIKTNEITDIFKYKIFKVFYSTTQSCVNLVADNRQVTTEVLHAYLPDIKGDFIQEGKDDEKGKNYVVRIYVSGKYLDENVTSERDGFSFENDADLFHRISRRDIEKKATEKVKELFVDEFTTRSDIKEKKIQSYVNEEAYWHKSYVGELDYSTIAYDISKEEIEIKLQEVKFKKEQSTKQAINKIIFDGGTEEVEKLEKIVDAITEVSKSDLVHYIASRKIVLEIFKKSLQWGEDKEFQKEQVVHDIIFPRNKDSNSVSFDQHNLWILDEKLNFHEYLASDKPLQGKGDRPDIVLFGNKVLFRHENEASNPIIIFEFKRPQRKEYSSNEDPIKQILRYVKQIRDGKIKTPEGRDVYAKENTPAYGYLVCDLTPKIVDFCKDNSLKQMPDGKGFFGFHEGHNVYLEVISFDKLVDDAELRNKIFFKTLNI